VTVRPAEFQQPGDELDARRQCGFQAQPGASLARRTVAMTASGRGGLDEQAICDDSMAELALGILSGRERAAALVHLERCTTCQAETASLSVVADALLLAGPLADPPVGFDLRLVERIGAAAVRSPRTRRWRRYPAALMGGRLSRPAGGSFPAG
jgi:hypothetical protein